MIIVGHHHEVIDVLDAVEAGQTLTAAVAAHRLTFGVGAEAVEHVNRHRDALVGGRDEVVRAVQAALDIPEQMLGAGPVDGAELGRRQPVVMRVAQRVRLKRSALLLVVKHESAVDELDVGGVVGWAGSSQHHNDLTAG